jgi:hypothetical protein
MTKKHPAPPPPLTNNGKDFSQSLSLLIGHYLSSPVFFLECIEILGIHL